MTRKAMTTYSDHDDNEWSPHFVGYVVSIEGIESPTMTADEYRAYFNDIKVHERGNDGVSGDITETAAGLAHYSSEYDTTTTYPIVGATIDGVTLYGINDGTWITYNGTDV